MRLLRILTQEFLTASHPDNADDYYDYIMFEFVMNYSLEGLRKGYFEAKEKQEKEVSNSMLRQLGYTEEDIQCRRK